MRTAAVVGIALALVVSGCSSISVNSDWNPETDFSRFSTYMWIDHDTGTDAITGSRIETAFDRALQARGFERVTSGADLAIGYVVTTEQRRSYTTVAAGWGGYRWGGWRGSSLGVATTTPQTWDVGSLVVGIFEVSSDQMVWQGTATSDLRTNLSPQERTQRINEGVEKMMRDFPPGR